METNKLSGFLDKAMELVNSMMELTGCELVSNNVRPILVDLKTIVKSIEDSDLTQDIIHNINTLLEEEGIARAENDAYMDETYDETYDRYCEDDVYNDNPYIDPMDSAEAAFAYIEAEDNMLYESDIADLEAADLYAEDYSAKEISDYANQEHPEVNTDLKEALDEIENAKANAAIWRARESIMGKIVFDNDDTYPIHSIDFEVDDDGNPVDIVISSREKYLDCIATNHSQLGYSLNEEENHGFKTALYGRLDNFKLYDYEGEPIELDSLPAAVRWAINRVMSSPLSQEIITDTLLEIAKKGSVSNSDLVRLLIQNLNDWDK